MFPLYRGHGLLVRVFSFNAHETTIMDEKLFGHENPNDKEPLAVWIILMMRQEWRDTMYHRIIQGVVSRCCKVVCERQISIQVVEAPPMFI